MGDLRDIIGRGKELTGRKLLDALEIAGKPPIGGRGVIVTARGSSDAVINRSGYPIVRPRKTIPAFLLGSFNFRQDVNGFNVEYEYDWAEAQINNVGEWEGKPGGRGSADPTRGQARNFAELLNEDPAGSGVSYGIPIDSLDPEYHIDGVFPIPNLQPVTLFEGFDLAGMLFAYYFEATNRLNLICGTRGMMFAGSASRVRPHPSGEAPISQLSRRVLEAEGRLR